MISHTKKLTALILCLAILLGLTGCGRKTSHYSAYVKSLITANYLGQTSEYVKLTGADSADAEALYLQNVTRLADNLSVYYGLDISGDEELAPAMVDLAKKIYGKAQFSVGQPYKDNNIYYVDVSIQPMDILNQTNQDVYNYIEEFNNNVAAGVYNNYTKEEYEYEFAGGIIGILADACNEMKYKEAETVKVRIITSEDTYYIGNEDLRAIDLAIIATKVKPFSPDDASATDAEPQ